MNVLQISLFGKFSVRCNEQAIQGFETKKLCELFCYLLLYRDRPHNREFLANLLWPNRTKAQSLKYLRHTLWQLQSALDASGKENANLLQVEAEWVSLNPDVPFWLDVASFEHTFELVQNKRGRYLNARQAQAIQKALKLYQGNLLQGWYQEWCNLERGRLQRTYLALLEKKMAYCEAHGKYEIGVGYGSCALRHDGAHERVHRRLMRLYYQAGNRTAALRQYAHCVTSLRQELNVAPSQRTVALYEQICSDYPLETGGVGHRRETGPNGLFMVSALQRQVTALQDGNQALMPSTLEHLAQLQITLTHTQRQIEEIIQSVQTALNDQVDH